MTSKNYIEGPRWAGLKKFLFRGALEYGLSITFLHEDKGWLIHTVYYELSGDGKKIDAFHEELKKGLAAEGEE